MLRRFARTLFYSLSLMAVSAQTLAAPEEKVAEVKSDGIITLTIQPDVYQDYIRFLDGRSPLDIKDFSEPFNRRDIADAIIFQQALALGGANFDIEFVLGNYYARNLKMLKKGLLSATLDSVWQQDLKNIQDHVYVTDAIIEKGEYEAGLYTSNKNIHTLNAKSLADVQKLKAIVNQNWKVDIQTLQSMGVGSITMDGHWTTIVTAVDRQLVDFVLAPFQQSEDLSFYINEKISLVPIPNIKVTLQGSRHFVVSKHHEYSEILFPAINKGLAELKANGKVRQAYTQAGFFNDRVKDWKTIF
ncbi:hypothetical protein HR060_02330 [Catenovulum sp. SM1970]|uniref:hypothetical protein n=1 Tax=Marinifaba aquimaris TaxID=2741323 RepID=UPI001572D5D2|nr:hypothetical protein [Marinifaba aquimaris]NTS75693.1 hypothetical protein [Marinifaba aquimaris]